MNKKPESIPKQPVLKPAEDYYRLRREGIGYIEQMASRLWTDYNSHDPGITLLEALCYALTDVAYRSAWEIKDILAPEFPPSNPAEPFPNQAFFTAREILTVNPVTPDDFRRLLIDLDGVRNAWVFCKQCGCDLYYYAWCEQDRLMLSYQKPAQPSLQPKKVEALGLYEILLELESDPEFGDLNDRKLVQTFAIEIGGRLQAYTLELRFPEWGLLKQDPFDSFIASADDPLSITLGKFSRSKVDNNTISDADLHKYWRNVFYVSFNFSAGGKAIAIENAALRIFSNAATVQQLTVNELDSKLSTGSTSGFIQIYRRKLQHIAVQIKAARNALHKHRNLAEDYCRVKVVSVRDIAVCADVEVASDADIERVQAQMWFEIEQYFNPPVAFYSLQELMDDSVPVEAIFNGPKLDGGFIRAEELEAAGLKAVLRNSDIINRLMDIEGVVAVNQLLLSQYDDEGQVIKGVYDPVWNEGKPVFDVNKASAAWLLFVSALHQPRLYHNQSRFLFYKNGLPFMPRMDEVEDTLMQLQGEAERSKIKNAAKDLPIPSGTFRSPEAYFPLQYSLPLVYGIGPAGLAAQASVQRKAQARQLKTYLMVFEQILGNAFAQLAHTADLFALDPSVARTYFVREFSAAVIEGYPDLIRGLDTAALEAMTETPPEFHERRNRFLDHLMARFGEQFGEYALLLSNYKGQQTALDRLIDDKIAFLKAYPLISHDRGRAFNYADVPCAPENFPGLKKRVSLLLGYPDLVFSWEITEPAAGQYKVEFQLKDGNGTLWLEGGTEISSMQPDTVIVQAYQAIMAQMVQADAYKIVVEFGPFRLKLKDKNGNALGRHPVLFKTQAEAQALRDELMGWSANERAIIVEHLLLRPKFPGDALYPACSEGACQPCGDEDPYSFRLTFVMPGWMAPYNVNLEMRRFADRTIRQETPAHLLAKICWIDNTGFEPDPCGEPVWAEVAELLEADGNTVYTREQACECARLIFDQHSQLFKPWFDARKTQQSLKAAWESQIQGLFAAIAPADFACTAPVTADTWTAVQQALLSYFTDIALHGWQFERFEDTWCQWLEANAKIDWTEERLQERVQAVLSANWVSGDETQLCRCATSILMQFGNDFYQWMESNLSAGHGLDALTAFNPAPIALCPGLAFKAGTAGNILSLLKERYTSYVEVSYRLWVLVNLLGQLSNTYPGATLHDCDDGSDQNPVRLGSTALGNYPLRTSDT